MRQLMCEKAAAFGAPRSVLVRTKDDVASDRVRLSLYAACGASSLVIGVQPYAAEVMPEARLKKRADIRRQRRAAPLRRAHGRAHLYAGDRAGGTDALNERPVLLFFAVSAGALGDGLLGHTQDPTRNVICLPFERVIRCAHARLALQRARWRRHGRRLRLLDRVGDEHLRPVIT